MIWFQYIREGTCRSAYCSSTTAALQGNLLKSCFKESRMQWDSCHSYCTVVGDSSRLYGCIWSVPDPNSTQTQPIYSTGFCDQKSMPEMIVEWEQVSSILLKLATFWKKNFFPKTHRPSLKQAGRVLMSTKDVPKEQKSVVSSCGNFELVVFLMSLSK